MASPTFRTKFDREVVEMTYTIHEFSEKKTPGVQFKTPPIEVVQPKYYFVRGFYCVFWPAGKCEEDKTFLSVAFAAPSKTYFSVKYTYRYRDDIVHSGLVKFEGERYIEQPKVISREIIFSTDDDDDDDYNYSDSLIVTLHCKKIERLKVLKDHDIFQLQISEDLKHLINNIETSDMKIKVNNTNIYVNKCILSCRSPVFKAMLSSGMKENRENVLEIHDLDTETVEEMVQYIYTGISPKLATLAHKLIGAAEKYNLEALKEMCEFQLIENLTSKNACSLLVLSEQYTLEELKNACLCHIYKNLSEVLKSSEFDSMLFSKPHLMKEIMNSVASKRFA